MDRVELLAASGFDIGWLRQMEQKHSPAVFDLVEGLLNQGFTSAWIVEAVSKLHPLLMDVFAHVFSAPAAARMVAARMGADGNGDTLSALVDGIPAGVLDGPVAIFLLEKLISLLPQLGMTGWKLTITTAALNVLLASLKSSPAKA